MQGLAAGPIAFGEAYWKHGMNVLPVGKGKRPVDEAWKRLQTHRQTADDLVALSWGRITTAGVAAILGPVSGGLVCVDLDGAPGRHTLDNLLARLDLPRDYHWAVRTPGKGGGFHVWVRSPELAEREVSAGVLEGHFPGAKQIELRWNGCYAILPGSRQEAGPYEWAHPNGSPVPSEPPAHVDPDLLLRLSSWGSGEDRKRTSEIPGVIEEGRRDNTLTSLAGTMRRGGFGEGAILASLRVENEEKCRPPLPDHDLERIARSVGKYPPGDPPTAPESVPLDVEEVQRAFMTSSEIRDHVSPHIEWVVEGLLGRSLFTVFGGKPKAGKTTAVFGLISAMSRGSAFAGLPAKPARVLVVTEQNVTTIRPKLSEYGLLGQDEIHFMFPRRLLGIGWSSVIAEVATYCETHAIEVLVVDTVNDLAHVQDENSSTEWLAALDPLQRLAHEGGLAVLAVLHAKKAAADIVDVIRGSGAIAGKADILLVLDRSGSGEETVRSLEGISRVENGFEEKVRIQRQGVEYVTVGSVREMELKARLAEYLAVLPGSREAARTRQEIAADLDVSPTTAGSYLTKMIELDMVASALRPGARGGAREYWASDGARRAARKCQVSPPKGV